MAEEHRPFTASYLVLQRDNEVLLMKRKNTGFKDGMYSLVAGHVDEGENYKQAMVREAKEEAGIKIDKKELETLTVMHRKSECRTYVDIFFKTQSWEGDIENREPEKCSELSWYETDDLPENTVYYVEKVLKGLNNGMNYQELGW